MLLSIVIPALDEEGAIGDTVRRCQAAADTVCAEAGLDGIELIVVDDGSTDRTAEIVRGISGVRLIQHPINIGYGAAITTGFEAATGELLAFLDADGTCDPLQFGPLARTLIAEGADVVSGSRLGKDNQMPAIRRLGNRIFAFLINRVSPQHVEDLASGMRVIRRTALPHLHPLPDGLHYTPAMSAKCLFDESVQLVEVPMPYAERVGESKLSVIRDGQRFLRVLGEIALSYRPFFFFGSAGSVLIIAALIYLAAPLATLLAGETLAPDRIYRMLTIVVLGSAGITLVGTGLVAEEATAILHRRRIRPGLVHRTLAALLMGRPFLIGTLLFLAAFARTFSSLRSYLSEGQIHEHWIALATGGLLALIGIQLFALGALQKILRMLAERQRAREKAGAGGLGAHPVDDSARVD